MDRSASSAFLAFAPHDAHLVHWPEFLPFLPSLRINARGQCFPQPVRHARDGPDPGEFRQEALQIHGAFSGDVTKEPAELQADAATGELAGAKGCLCSAAGLGLCGVGMAQLQLRGFLPGADPVQGCGAGL